MKIAILLSYLRVVEHVVVILFYELNLRQLLVFGMNLEICNNYDLTKSDIGS